MEKVWAVVMVLVIGLSGAAQAGIIGPYTADANTLFLYHLDETSGASDPGNPIVNTGSKGTTFNLTDTGGPDGRSNTTAGGYGAAAYAGFGTSFDVYDSGNGIYNPTASATGGGAHTVGVTMSQADFQGASGEFTYEALVKLPNSSLSQVVISRDGSITRGFTLQIVSGELSIYTGGATNYGASIPTTGDHAFVANEWFHAAVAYNGNAGASGNSSFYWTRVDGAVTEANLIGTATFSSDANANMNQFYIGTTGRSAYRNPVQYVDEVRISNVVRGSQDFIFSAPIPEPGSFAVWALGLAGMVGRKRRK